MGETQRYIWAKHIVYIDESGPRSTERGRLEALQRRHSGTN